METHLLYGVRATRRQLCLYAALYLVWGLCMNGLGKLLRIAEFVSWWQVVSCYVLYLVPASLLVRRYGAFQQYLYGLLALAPLELAGYAIGSSRAYPGNLVDQVLGERNFTLAMVVFFAGILPLGNRAVAGLERLLFGEPAPRPLGDGRLPDPG